MALVCVFVCFVPLSQPSNRDLDYPLWNVHVPEIKKCIKKENTFKLFAYYFYPVVCMQDLVYITGKNKNK